MLWRHGGFAKYDGGTWFALTTGRAVALMFAMLAMMIATLFVASVLVQLRMPTCSPAGPAMMLSPPSAGEVYRA